MTAREGAVDRAAAWIYRGLWGILVDLFRVPREPPTLPARQGESIQTFNPAPGYLAYLKFWFWIALFTMDVGIIGGWIAICFASPIAGALLALPAWALAIVPDIIAYVAIHLRYDTTWYVMTPRSIRLRRGVWIVHEVTITFENVQNVKVVSGPVQRGFGIANVIIETAGAGAGGPPGHGGAALNRGVIEGVADAERIRDLIMDRVRASSTAGLGDDRTPAHVSAGLSPAHLAVLREIRGLVAAAQPGSRST
jgi:membrane protein YdbS with pleckstrin-like domain